MTKTDYILICEDSEFVLQIASFALEAEGFIVETAKNTSEIFRKLEKENKPSLIFLDLSIPETGGEEVLRQLRQKEDTKNIPVILFSAAENLKEIADRLGVQGILKKPFDNEELKKIAAEYIPLVKH